MNDYIVPEVGAIGTYTFKPPFDTLISDKTQYECMSVRSISDAIATGEDVFGKYYHTYGLSKEQYTQDSITHVSLLRLKSALGQWVNIPNSYLVSFPDASGVSYRVMSLAVDLGAIADSHSLDTMISEVQDLVFTRLGVYPQVLPVATSAPITLSYQDHERIENARQSRATVQNSLLLKYNTAVAQRDELQRKYDILADYIKKQKA